MMSPSSMYHWFARPPAKRAACHKHRWAFLYHRAGSLPIPAVWPRGLHAVAVPLQSRSGPIQGRVRLPCGNASSRLGCHHAQRQAALQGAIKVSLRFTSILRHWREPFLFNKGQVLVFPRCCCHVLWEEPRRRLASPSIRSSRSNFLINFDSGQRSTE